MGKAWFEPCSTFDNERNGERGMRNLWSRTTYLVFGTLAAVALSGCNAGVGLVAQLLLDDDDSSGNNRSSAESSVVVEFLGVRNARSQPQDSVIEVRLTSDRDAENSISVAYRVVGSANAFAPATLLPPVPGEVSVPGTIDGIDSSPTGTFHRIGWNALSDLGDTEERQVTIRFSGEAIEELEVSVLVGNDPPSIDSTEFSQDSGEDVVVDIVLEDSALDPVDLVIEFSTDPLDAVNPQFFLATTRGPTRDLATSPDLTHRFFWRAVEDVGRIDRPAVLRVTPFDRVDEQSGKQGEPSTDGLNLDNNVSPRIVFAAEDLQSDLASRRGIALRFSIEDREQNPVDAIIQWSEGGTEFPPLPAELDEDASARRELVTSPTAESEAARRALQIASLTPQTLDGPVELTSNLDVPEGAVLATWLKLTHELRGISDNLLLVGSPVEVIAPDGTTVQSRRVCEYEKELGILFLNEPFEPPPPPGSLIRIDISSPLFLSSRFDGIVHTFVWNSPAELPGGGDVRFRVTPFDHAASATDDGCGLVVINDEEVVARGARGGADENVGNKFVEGPFRTDTAEVIELSEVDNPIVITTADVDSDGRLDVIYAAQGEDAIVAKLQTEPNRYDDLRLLDARIVGISGLAVDDFDDNDLIDFAASSTEGASVLVIFQLPDNDFFSTRANLKSNRLTNPGDLVTADLNGDGLPDIATLNENADDPIVVAFLRTGGTTPPTGCAAEKDGFVGCEYNAPNESGLLKTLAAGTIDDDDAVDLVAGGDGLVALFFNGGDGSFDRSEIISTPSVNFADLITVDIDDDGRLDLAGVDSSAGTLVALFQDGNGDFSEDAVVLLSDLQSAVSLAAADVDGNGITDFAITEFGDPDSGVSGNVRTVIALENRNYSSAPLSRPTTEKRPVRSPAAVTFADLNSDGRLDVISGEQTSSEVAIYRSTTRGSFPSEAQIIALDDSILGAASAPASLVAADVTADGHVDLLTAHPQSDEVVLLDQLAAGTFEPVRYPLPGTSGSSPSAIAAGDVNGDGFGDFVTANADSASLTVFLQAADGSFDETHEITSTDLDGPQAALLGDFDGNGLTDVAAAGRFSNTVVVFLQDQSGAFMQSDELGTPSLPSNVPLEGPVALSLVDINGDGQTDIVSANQLSENLVIFVQGGTPIEIPLGEGNRPAAVAAGDLNDDGNLDFVTANTSGDAVTLALGNGIEFMVAPLLPAEEGREATSVALGDLSSDGRLDVAVSYAGDLPSVLRVLIQGEQPDFSDASPFDLSAEEMDAPIDVAAVDIDCDGELDLIAANRTSANIAIFYGGR